MNFRNISAASKMKTTRGFTLVELIIVIALIALLAIFSLPAVRGMLVSGKVEPTASDVNKAVASLRGNFSGQGNTPYVNLGTGAAATAVFANTARGRTSALTVSAATGAAATIQHDLGATNSQIAVASSTITAAGDSFTVTLPTVNEAACPGLAAQLSRSAELITVNGVVAKAVGGTYNGGTAQNACTAGDTNAFVFTFR
ncbi:type 4 pilus major pilin [Variovorax gossypii]|uniref:type 4 pilus major pilin n=1 Tax=uncultured Variovorax sp. TaxID=114708 RepID=UPI002603CB6E|nr:type 4 pilus major pilin [uncultured Variovorax sp.]